MQFILKRHIEHVCRVLLRTRFNPILQIPTPHYHSVKKSIRRDFFPQKVMKNGGCALVGRWRVPSCAYVDFFPASRQHQSRAASMWVRVYTQRASHSAKMTEPLEQRYCIKFCQKLGDSQVDTVRKIQCVLVTMAWASHKLRSGTTNSKMTARRWRASLVLVGPQQAQMTSSIDQVRTLVIQDRRITVRELAEEGGISTGSVHSILTDNLALRRVSAKFVPKLIQTFLAKHNIPVVRQAPYSPDIAPCDY
jgi:hypothetical protein